MVSIQVSVITLSLSCGNSKRRARIATCCCDSSPVTYKADRCWAILHSVCRRMVDLPIPGSPPINTTEPLTRPPPSTRSSSDEPLGWRGVSSVETSARVFTWAISPAQLPPREPPPLPPVGVVSMTVSTRVFHARHSLHCPAHLLEVAPQSVQP